MFPSFKLSILPSFTKSADYSLKAIQPYKTSKEEIAKSKGYGDVSSILPKRSHDLKHALKFPRKPVDHHIKNDNDYRLRKIFDQP